jgi:transcriptional regulator with XRE-family HTH domain
VATERHQEARPVRVVKLVDRALLLGLMDRRQLSNRGLATAAGVAHGIVAGLAAGRKTGVTPATAGALASALGVPVDALFPPIAPDGHLREALDEARAAGLARLAS